MRRSGTFTSGDWAFILGPVVAAAMPVIDGRGEALERRQSEENRLMRLEKLDKRQLDENVLMRLEKLDKRQYDYNPSNGGGGEDEKEQSPQDSRPVRLTTVVVTEIITTEGPPTQTDVLQIATQTTEPTLTGTTFIPNASATSSTSPAGVQLTPSSNNTGRNVGIGIGAAAGVVLLALAIFAYFRFRRGKWEPKETFQFSTPFTASPWFRRPRSTVPPQMLQRRDSDQYPYDSDARPLNRAFTPEQDFRPDSSDPTLLPMPSFSTTSQDPTAMPFPPSAHVRSETIQNRFMERNITNYSTPTPQIDISPAPTRSPPRSSFIPLTRSDTLAAISRIEGRARAQLTRVSSMRSRLPLTDPRVVDNRKLFIANGAEEPLTPSTPPVPPLVQPSAPPSRMSPIQIATQEATSGGGLPVSPRMGMQSTSRRAPPPPPLSPTTTEPESVAHFRGVDSWVSVQAARTASHSRKASQGHARKASQTSDGGKNQRRPMLPSTPAQFKHHPGVEVHYGQRPKW